VKSPLLAAGAINALLSVAAGAFGAHGLRERLEPRALEIFETGARYQMYHALAMVLCAVVATTSARNAGPEWSGGGFAATAGWIFPGGIVGFWRDLYAPPPPRRKVPGAHPPTGGLAFLVGWAWLAWGALRG